MLFLALVVSLMMLSTNNMGVLSLTCNKHASRSQSGEENDMIKHFFRGQENGVYVEIGALDGMKYTNTLKLHQCFNWSGILIEGQPSNAVLLKVNVAANRPTSKAFHGAVCAPPATTARFSALRPTSAVGGDAAEMAESFQLAWFKPDQQFVDVPCCPMSEYIRNLTLIHFFSLDVEGAELTVIETIDFTVVHIDLFMIEFDSHSPQKNFKIRRLLFNLNYVECIGAVRNSAVFLHKKPSETSYRCPYNISTLAVPDSVVG